MSETMPNDLATSGVESLTDKSSLPGIIAALGELGSGAVITEEGVAHLFNRHEASVKRAVQRGELPPPCRLFGSNTWTAGAVIGHIEKRLEEAAREAENEAKRIVNLSP